MIDKNTIYSYFQTDDFPTEAQFRATWDSFWHKSESIPMSQITGLNQLFQQTATVAQLNNKANVDGSNIDVPAYQEKLNITNLIATAKEEVKTELLNGAPEAFDTLKEISDWISDDGTAEAAILQAIQNEATARTNADNLKLNKPTTTSNTTSYPYVVGEDGNGGSARLPAGDLGKNFFNSDLSNTTARNHTMNAGVTVNTLGNPYSITGLPDKASDTTNFDKVLKYNPSTGQFAHGQAFVYNVPSTITVNHVNAPASPDVPSYVQAIQDRITQLHQPEAVMQKFTNWNIVTLNNLQNTNTNVRDNETINTYLQPFFNDSTISVGSDIISIYSSKVLPRNSDFAIRFSVKLGHNGVPAYGQIGNVTNRLIGLFTGTVGAFCSPELYVYDTGGEYNNNLLSLQSTGAEVKTISQRAATDTSTVIYTGNQQAVINFIILKVEDNILVQANYGTKTLSEIYPASVIGSGDFGFCVKVQKPGLSNSSTGNVSNIRYYIFP